MTPKEYNTRYETILNMKLDECERQKLLAGLLVDLERAFQPSFHESKIAELENDEFYVLYRKVLQNLR